MAAKVQFGQVVWVDIAEDNGVIKGRPAIVVTPNDWLADSEKLDIVAVTSRVPDPLPDDQVLLPWHAQRHPRTGLNRKCAAVCSWVVQVSIQDIQNIIGMLSGSPFEEILRKIAPKPPRQENSLSPDE